MGIGDLPKDLAEAGNGLVEQDAHGLRRAVPPGDARAARGQDDLNLPARDPAGNHRADLINVVGHNAPIIQPVALRREPFREAMARCVGLLRARVRYRQHRNIQRHKLAS